MSANSFFPLKCEIQFSFYWIFRYLILLTTLSFWNFLDFKSPIFLVSLFYLWCLHFIHSAKFLPPSNSSTLTMLPSQAIFSLIQSPGMLHQIILWSCHLSNHSLSDLHVPFISSSAKRVGPLVICTLLPGMILTIASGGY